MSGSDIEDFGRLARARRLQIGISQEAVAAAAFGNPDRKSFVSAIENARRPNLTWGTAQQLAAALGISRADVPPSLQWPDTSAPAPDAPIDEAAIARALAPQLEQRLRQSMMDIYTANLRDGLIRVRAWTGAPFSLQSLAFSYALALFYVAMGGLAGFAAHGPPIGAVDAFASPDPAVPNWARAMAALAVLATCGWCAYRMVRGAVTGLRRERFVQIAGGAFVCGIGCVVAGLLGADALAVAPIMAVAAFAALATWAPRHAALAGLLGGLVAGISAGAIDEKGAWLGALEGAAIGGLIGALAGYVSAKLGRNARVLAGAGAGIASGVGLITLVLLALQQSDALDRQSEGILVLMWITLPLVNAISDYVSLGVSHWLGLRASRRATGVIGYLFLGILDLVVAVALLALTAALIKSGLSLADTIFASDLSPYAFLAAAVADPWGDGIWLSLMIISTLTWTYLHFAFAIVPAILASVILVLWEAPLLRRTQAMAAGGTLDFGVMTLIPLRRITFFVAWIVLALAPIWALFIASDMMERVLAALF